MTENYLEKIKSLVSQQLGVDESEVSAESHLRDDLNADPLSLADLMDKIEETFSITIPEGRSSSFETVADIVEFVSDQSGDI